MSSVLLTRFFEKIELQRDNTIKSIKVSNDKEEKTDKPYALKAFSNTMGSYHYKRNVNKKKPNNNEKKNDFVVIEKLEHL